MQLYLILAAAFMIWSGVITTTAYYKGRTAGVSSATETCNNTINKQKEESAAIMAVEVANVAATEKKLHEFKDNREVQDAKNKQEVDVLSGRVRALSGIIGRLRDPNAGRGESDGITKSGTPTDTSNSVYNRAEASGILSKQLTEFLFDQAESCDQINLAYTSCREDSMNIRGLK